MNRRRFLGSIAAITAALGVTRVPDSVQASAPSVADQIAQARADGYNRGREVEAARQEAHSDPHAHCGPDCDQWRDLLQWDWANPAVVTRSGSFVSGGVVNICNYRLHGTAHGCQPCGIPPIAGAANVVGYHEPVRSA